MTVHHGASRSPWVVDRIHPPSAEVEAWRRDRLLEAGFDPDLAESIAADPLIDLHAMLQLLDRGCPPALAVRILAPLPDALPARVAR